MAEYTLRASVRRIVEFTLQSGDILPVSLSSLQAGTRGHLARQADAGAHSERKVQWMGEYLGLNTEISGRIDILHENDDLPLIEEVKLISPAVPLPEAPVPVHRMQAVCYAHMLCEELNLPSVAVQVSYVTENGEIRAHFYEKLSSGKAAQHFFSMLHPFAAWEKQLLDFRRLRDASLLSLPFPYDAYRPGQREMAAQVYTAIKLQKRLFATLPTGTGKSAATLFPALKALGEGKTRQIFCLTARGTAQDAAADALRRMRDKGLRARSVIITAKEKCCSEACVRCHPDHCPRARGYFDREREGIKDLLKTDDWNPQTIALAADKHSLCPFELSLSLCEIADVVICDYNYAFDPAVRLQRIFERGLKATLLIDEAHNLPSRVRGMLGAVISSAQVADIRREEGKQHGRKTQLYKAFAPLIKALREGNDALSQELLQITVNLLSELTPLLSNPAYGFLSDFSRELLSFRFALERALAAPEDYKVLVSGEKEKTVQLLSLNIGAHLKECTKRMTGCIFYSATLSPLHCMKDMLGGEEDDAIFALPSPFPPENLLVLQKNIDTRYTRREDTIEDAAQCILALFDAMKGSYIAFFPSYAYMALAAEKLLSLRSNLPLNIQQRGMDDASREIFLDRIRHASGPLLSLCVLGGVFSEGIDLPGLTLIGAIIVGVGLPQVNNEQEYLRQYYEGALHDGFGFAYRYPGMHKVLQAAGRVIRSETDLGVLLLLDTRYRENAYARLLPPHYHVQSAENAAEIRTRTEDFWQMHGILQ